MTQATLAEASNDLRRHLDKYNWTGQSPSRRRILSEFLRLATAHGFDSVSMRMLAKAVDIKAPSIYAHFPDGRDEIVAESLRWHFHQFGIAMLTEVDKTTGTEDAWAAMVRVHLTRQLRLPESNLWDLLVATDKMANFLPTEVRIEADNWVALYERMYLAAAAELGAESSEEAVRIVMAVLESATRWCNWDGSDEHLEHLVDRAVALTRTVLDWSTTTGH